MSDGAKLRLVAVGAAFIALAFTLVAAIVVLTRDNAPTKPSASSVVVSDHLVHAADLLRLRTNDVELVERGTTKGLRVKDAELAKTLGLQDGDVIVALSGKAMTRQSDLFDATSRIYLLDPATIYVDIARNNGPVLLRWKLDGDLRDARDNATASAIATAPSMPPSYAPPSTIDPFASPHGIPVPDPLDPLLDSIEKVDDTHVRVPNKVIDAVLANPMAVAKGARVVPAMKNGKADGFKLYAIRPSSLYARLGFENGDTIHAVNGFPLTSADKALEVYTKLRDATSIELDITRRGQDIVVGIEITK